MKEEIIGQQALYEKYRNTKSSGYLDDEYELTPEFRQVDEYYFRIEDQKQIIQLQNLQKKSTPMQAGFSVPSQASQDFTKKMDNLLASLDKALPMRQGNSTEIQTHGFYTLGDDAYDQKKTLEAAYEHLQMQNLNKRMQSLTINQKNIKFIPNPNKMQNCQEKQLVKKMKKMNIGDKQL